MWVKIISNVMLKRMDISFSPLSVLNVHPMTKVNGNICYGIKTYDCPVKYVFISEETTFIATKYANVIHIFNLKNDGAFPEDFKRYIEQIRAQLNDFFFKPLSIGESVRLWRKINKNSHNFAMIRRYSESECKPLIDLSNAKSIVHQLNAALQPKFPEFHLHIDYLTSFPPDSVVSLYSDLFTNVYFEPQIVLCLFTGNNCVSSITINVTRSEMTIDSRTNEHYEGRKFNTLLRAVAIIVSKSLNERAERLVSSAVNVVSALLMIKRFNAVLRNGDISSKTVPPEQLDKVINEYFAHHEGMETCVELNEENIANATTVFHKTIDRMPKGGRKKKYTRGFKKSKKHNKRSNKRFNK